VRERYRTAVIGRTGRGNYGHNLHLAWKSAPRVEIVAVADEHPEGLKKAAAALGIWAAYRDYREMLRQERPDIVIIAPRWVDCHLDMVLAAAEARASVFMEKPMGRTPAECDRMIDACERAHVKLSVAYNFRVHPMLDHVQQLLKSGLIGEIQEIRGRGKEDRRAGGEDLMVLGTHVFDLLRRFAGDPLWAFGHVTRNGRDIERQDIVMDGPEGLGPIAGDTIAGMFDFAGGLTAYFASRKSSDTKGSRWGIDLFGTEGILAIRAQHVPEFLLCKSARWSDGAWSRLEVPPGMRPVSETDAYHLMAEDLMQAIEQDREPAAGGRNALWTTEMAMALYASQRTGRRIPFPLKDREHPLVSERPG
jgi:predicted dehydrogenase